ncbi:hypothetical protein [Hymenobacter wooponensis]|uniref:Glycosyltransferase RgtA/B/C/D-like domain-containing protein n=1 Tax=Hymenobacter wooponensis TaxID=1525360 RepID=A0A4Z0MFJ5_9BACT|nr:hypothetical protein [Hymenobacter wooponensis]TGD78532.1 hypothetical protein EU557_20750 [Hymenobacter wooponensis]
MNALATIKAVTQQYPRGIVISFFVFFLLLGLLVYHDYGMSVDEEISRNNGMVTLKYLLQRFDPDFVAQDPAFASYSVPLEEYFDRDYGVAFETPTCYLERLLRLETTRERFLFRHLATFVVCWGGCVAFYQLARRRFGSWQWGLLGALWLVLSPRLFADFFYNDKDAVFMALFAVGLNTGVRLVLRPTLSRVLWHALACALTIDVRIMGVLLPAATLALLLVRVVYGEVRPGRALGLGGLYAALTAGLVVAFWPYLWPAPLDNFLLAWHNMSHFRWGGYVLYQASVQPATTLPWHYAPVWIGISTPLLYVVSFLLGGNIVIWQMVRRLRAGGLRLWRTEQEMQDVLFLGLGVLPILTVIVLKSVLYDGWRQLYFVYPPLLLIAVRGLWALWHWRPAVSFLAMYWSRVVGLTTGVCMLSVAGQMMEAHPLQNVYFSPLAGPNAPQHFEVDYWGLSYRQGLEWILTNDPRPHIVWSAPAYSSAPLNIYLLSPEDQSRLSFVEDQNQADYFLTTYRQQPQEYEFQNKEVYQLRANGRRVLSVFRMRW